MTGQLNLFDIYDVIVKPCECGNCKLAVRYTGCGIPQYIGCKPTYDKYIFTLFCPKCYRVATASLGWRSNKSSMLEAVKDWNNNPRKVEKIEFIGGLYGLKYYADIMPETIKNFTSIRKVLDINNTYLGG